MDTTEAKQAVEETAKNMKARHAEQVSAAIERVNVKAADLNRVREKWSALRALFADFEPPELGRMSLLSGSARSFVERLEALDTTLGAMVRALSRELDQVADAAETLGETHVAEREAVTAALAALEAKERAESEAIIKALQRANVKLVQKGA